MKIIIIMREDNLLDPRRVENPLGPRISMKDPEFAGLASCSVDQESRGLLPPPSDILASGLPYLEADKTLVACYPLAVSRTGQSNTGDRETLA